MPTSITLAGSHNDSSGFHLGTYVGISRFSSNKPVAKSIELAGSNSALGLLQRFDKRLPKASFLAEPSACSGACECGTGLKSPSAEYKIHLHLKHESTCHCSQTSGRNQ